MQPIETRYANCLFRSRLEARWAVFFDALGIKWEYEPEGYELNDGSRYLPDFRLPYFDGGMWVEVKPMGGDFRKPLQFIKSGADKILLAVGTPACCEYTVITTEDDGSVMECNNAFSDKYITGSHRDEHRMFWLCGGEEDILAKYNPDVAKAVEAARSARFEHGQSGAIGVWVPAHG